MGARGHAPRPADDSGHGSQCTRVLGAPPGYGETRSRAPLGPLLRVVRSGSRAGGARRRLHSRNGHPNHLEWPVFVSVTPNVTTSGVSGGITRRRQRPAQPREERNGENTAPVGSWMTDNRPTFGISIEGTST